MNLLRALVIAAGAWLTTGLAATPPVQDELSRLLTAAADAERRHDPQTALGYYRQAAAIRPDDPVVLQKIAQQISDGFFLDPGMAQGRERVEEALRHARRAVELDPASAINELSLGILYGRLAGFGGASEKVEYARLVFQHAERALMLDPDYAWAHHVLGLWHLEMASLGTTRRALVAVFFGGLPKASRAEGLRFLERAVELEPEGIAHRVELGFACERLGRRDEARQHWARCLELTAVAIYDRPAQERARVALERLGPG